MATPNYGYEKRQKELAKKRKKEEKLKAKSERKPEGTGDEDGQIQHSGGTDPDTAPNLPVTDPQP